jgi:teichuronic acid biosynthesis glycosyltransferase TuaC
MRALVVTNMQPTPARPALGRFVQDQVDALRRLDGVEVELFAFPPGLRSYPRAALELRRRYRGRRLDVVHAHFGLTAWPALAVRGAPHVVTFHGTDLAHPRSGRLSRGAMRLVTLPATVSAALARERNPGCL